MFDERTFVGKRIMVTGASSGIGRSTAILLSQLGANIVLIGRDGTRLQSTLDKMATGDHTVLSFDLQNFDEYDAMLAQCIAKGKLDGLVHCAGIAKVIPIKAVSVNNIHETMDTNFTSFLMLMKYLSKKRFTNDGASFVVLSAINAHYPQKCMSVYVASKAALEAAVKTLALELYERKMRINTLVVGPVATPMGGFPLDSEEGKGVHSDITPNLMGLALPQQIAEMAAYLLSDACSYTTGRNFYVDGGRL